MRSVKLSIGILVLLIAGAITYVLLLNHTTNGLASKVETIRSYAQQDDWAQVNQSLAAFQQDFKRAEKLLTTLVNHYETDSIAGSLEKLMQYGIYEEKADFMAELYTLDLLIRHLPEKERLNLENFL